MKRKVAIIKLTGICAAPDFLVKAINLYSKNYEATLIGPDGYANPGNEWLLPPPESMIDPLVPVIYLHGLTNYEELAKIDLKQFDVIHFHNRFIKTDVPAIIQYHSPPYNWVVDFNFPGPKYVLAQYHATLKEYADCKPVRNIIDFHDSLYNPNYNIHKIRIGYSPSSRTSGRSFESKGFNETMQVLGKIKSMYDNIEIDLIERQLLDHCIARKSLCNILIDECVTKSYHRSGLEGLALGKVTVCSLEKDVENLIKQTSGSSTIPFENIWIEHLEKGLEELICQGPSGLNEMGRKNHDWMEIYWNPKTIVEDFEKLYDSAIENYSK